MTTGGIIVKTLYCRRNETILFRDLSFAVDAGCGLFVRGPNGAGKSSLLRLLAGLLTPEAGTIALAGQAQQDDLQAYHRHIAYLGHLDGLKSAETVREALAFKAKLSPVSAAIHNPASLDPMGIASLADTPIRSLSAGQRRRVALAGVWASDAALWLLDEPTTGLDAAAAAMVYDTLAAHLAKGGLFIVATHDTPPALANTATLVLGS